MYNNNLYNKIINSISKVVKQQINEAFDFSNISDNKSKNIMTTYNQAWVQEYIDRLIAKDNTLMEDDNFIKMLCAKTPLYKAKSKEEVRTIYEAGLKESMQQWKCQNYRDIFDSDNGFIFSFESTGYLII